MQTIDFDEVTENKDYASIPEGCYRCKIGEVRVGMTRNGHERWAYRLEVANGEYAGRTAGWDGLVFSERGLPRVKYVLSRLGFDTTGRVSLEPNDIQGRHIEARLIAELWEDPVSGKSITRLTVPYEGYERVTTDESPAF